MVCTLDLVLLKALGEKGVIFFAALYDFKDQKYLCVCMYDVCVFLRRVSPAFSCFVSPVLPVGLTFDRRNYHSSVLRFYLLSELTWAKSS